MRGEETSSWEGIPSNRRQQPSQELGWFTFKLHPLIPVKWHQ